MKRYDPKTDALIAANYSAEDLSGKAKDKAELQRMMELREEPDTPILAVVSRLVSHKGLDLIKDVFHDIMVINVGWVKDAKWDQILEEIKAVKAACKGKLLKVIIETCFLTDAEKIRLCGIVTDSGADFIKTSTGFGGGGATREDVALFKAHATLTLLLREEMVGEAVDSPLVQA